MCVQQNNRVLMLTDVKLSTVLHCNQPPALLLNLLWTKWDRRHRRSVWRFGWTKWSRSSSNNIGFEIWNVGLGLPDSAKEGLNLHVCENLSIPIVKLQQELCGIVMFANLTNKLRFGYVLRCSITKYIDWYTKALVGNCCYNFNTMHIHNLLIWRVL